MKALLNLFVESAANDQTTYSEWNNLSVVNRTATSEQSRRRKEPTPRRKQSTQAKQLPARIKNALVRVTLQENKITPNSGKNATNQLIHVFSFRDDPATLSVEIYINYMLMNWLKQSYGHGLFLSIEAKFAKCFQSKRPQSHMVCPNLPIAACERFMPKANDVM